MLALLTQGTRCHTQVPMEQGEGRLQGWGRSQGSVREGSSVKLGRGSEADLKALPRGQRQSCPQLPRWSPWSPCREDSRAGCGWRRETAASDTVGAGERASQEPEVGDKGTSRSRGSLGDRGSHRGDSSGLVFRDHFGCHTSEGGGPAASLPSGDATWLCVLSGAEAARGSCILPTLPSPHPAGCLQSHPTGNLCGQGAPATPSAYVPQN